MKPVLKLLAALCLLVLTAAAGKAAEVIELFDARITAGKDGAITVVETIRVRGEGRKIRRGIYRDFPVTFKDANGRERKVAFQVMSIKRDGVPEDYHIKSLSRSERVYIGKSSRLIGAGTFVYQITYKTDRQIRFFDTHDELFWNVTGNFWDFPILNARAEFILPDGAQADDLAVFTGRRGSRAANAELSLRGDGNRVFAATTQALKRYEGLSVAIRMAQGTFTAPTTEQKLAWFWRDNKSGIVVLGALWILVLYYLWAWARVGRDPTAGVIVPRWDTPQELSPALVSYINRRGASGHQAFSAALLSLAVKGHVTLEDLAGKDMRYTATDKRPADGELPVGEQKIYDAVFAKDNGFRIDKKNGKKVVALASGFRGALSTEHRNKFFVFNVPWIIAGTLMSIAAIVFAFAVAIPGAEIVPVAIVGTVALIMVPMLLYILFTKAIDASGPGFSVGKVMRWLVFGFFAFNLLPSVGAVLAFSGTSPMFATGLISIVALNGLFWYLLGAPTPLGREKMDHIAGLKTYIELAEADRMNLAGAPKMSPQHYETLLPYAVALGLEKPWTGAFEDWLQSAASAVQADSYNPNWYRGSNFNASNLGSSLGNISSSIASSMTNAAPAPSSSSSGFSGGGGSGGGGGGGGGGGW